jgi:hypothetical protein
MSKDLRTQFIDYMTLQRFSPHTKRGYHTRKEVTCRRYRD